MRNLYLILLFFLGFISAHAQKADLDKQHFVHNYRRLPIIVLPDSYKTYFIEINKAAALSMYSNATATSRVNIEGRTKADSNPTLLVSVNLGDLMIESTEVKERVQVTKDKDGKETGRKYYYRVEAKYSFEADAKTTDNTGKVLRDYTLSSRYSKSTWSSNEFSSSTAASNYYNNNKIEIKSQLINKEINEALDKLNTDLNWDFGYKTIQAREHIWTLDSKKHPEYVAYVEACNKLKAILESMTADKMPADIETQLQPVIEYFSALPEKYSSDPKDKGQTKIRYGAYFNLASLYLYIEQFDKAADYANKLIANEYDHKDGQKMLEEINGIKVTFEKHGTNTRHFIPKTAEPVVGQ